MDLGYELSGFRVLSTLGYGAKSRIFIVRDTKTQRHYALKQVVRKDKADDRYIEQAIKEHEISIKLDHPVLRKSIKLFKKRSLFQLKEVHVQMELIEGITLEQERPKNLAQIIRMFIDICEGLHEMHKKGFVHADMKPNNVLRTPDEAIKIIDFGQSCAIGTIKERIQGTPDYIAPEQVRREPINPYTDIFNVGATMYWVLTHKNIPTLIPPDNPKQVLKSMPSAKDPREINPYLPPALSNLILQCVRENWSERPSNMKKLSDRLTAIQQQIELIRRQRKKKDGSTDSDDATTVPAEADHGK
jgi:serine/threonine-protein kinase